MELIQETPAKLVLKINASLMSYIFDFFILLLAAFLLYMTIRIAINGGNIPYNLLAFGLICLVAGIYFLSTNKSTYLTFDKEKNNIYMVHGSILKKDFRSYDFSEVKEIVLSGSLGKNAAYATLVFILVDSDIEVVIDSMTSNSSNLSSETYLRSKFRKDMVKSAKQIADFMGKPFKEIQPEPAFVESLAKSVLSSLGRK